MVDAGMGWHAEIVIGTPDSHILLTPRIFFGVGEPVGLSQHLLENAVRMVLLLLVDLIAEEIFVGEESLRCFLAGCQVDKILIDNGGWVSYLDNRVVLLNATLSSRRDVWWEKRGIFFFYQPWMRPCEKPLGRCPSNCWPASCHCYGCKAMKGEWGMGTVICATK